MALFWPRSIPCLHPLASPSMAKIFGCHVSHTYRSCAHRTGSSSLTSTLVAEVPLGSYPTVPTYGWRITTTAVFLNLSEPINLLSLHQPWQIQRNKLQSILWRIKGKYMTSFRIFVLSCTVVALAAVGGAQVNVTTWHYDVGRTGQNNAETTLTTTLVSNPQTFGKICGL